MRFISDTFDQVLEDASDFILRHHGAASKFKRASCIVNSDNELLTITVELEYAEEKDKTGKDSPQTQEYSPDSVGAIAARILRVGPDSPPISRGQGVEIRHGWVYPSGNRGPIRGSVEAPEVGTMGGDAQADARQKDDAPSEERSEYPKS